MTKTKKPMPQWVADKIAVDTGIDPTGPVSRRARRDRCPTCRVGILRGLDGEVGAWDVRVDPTPLTPLGEAVAQLAGLATYEQHSEGGRFVLDHRDPWRIRSRPAGQTTGEDVHAAHDCGRRWDLPATRAPSQIAARYFNRPTDPPF